MIHFLWSIFFLICTIGLVLVYSAGIIVAAFLALFVIKLLNGIYGTRSISRAWVNAVSWLGVLLSKVFRLRPILFFLLFICSINISLYCKQRVEWMGEDNGNLTAKEYWIAGQVVYGYRYVFCQLKHPDRLFIQPFTLLQEWIYQKGIPYLPENDGEIGVWTDIWFVYPYSKQSRIAIGSSGYKPSPKMIALVERAWFALEKEATGTWADYQMKTQHYFRNFPGQAFYYVTNKGFLTGKKVGSRTLYSQDQRLLARDRKLVGWLDALPEQWQTAAEAVSFIKQNQKIEALQQITMLRETGDLIYGSIFQKTFTCNSEEIKSYLALREALVANKETVLLRVADKSQGRTFYNLAVNTESARYLRYSLKRFCRLEATGQEDMENYKGTRQTPEEWRDKSVQGLFPDETKILEEMYHGR